MNGEEKKVRHQQKLNASGIKFTAIGKWETGNNPRMLYKCENGHEHEASRDRMTRGAVKCPSCAGSEKKRNHAGYEACLMEIESELYPVEEYKGTDIRIKHSCVEGHIHEYLPQRVLTGAGCVYCNGMVKKTPEMYIQALKDKGIKHTPAEPYITAMTKIKHECYVCNHIWSVKPHDIMHGSSCPSCARMGFNRNKPAWLYYVRLSDERQTLYKIGITNKTPKERLRVYKKEKKILLEKYYETGAEAEAAEQMILEEYKDMLVYNPKFISSGYTELFGADILLLDVDYERK